MGRITELCAMINQGADSREFVHLTVTKEDKKQLKKQLNKNIDDKLKLAVGAREEEYYGFDR